MSSLGWRTQTSLGSVLHPSYEPLAITIRRAGAIRLALLGSPVGSRGWSTFLRPVDDAGPAKWLDESRSREDSVALPHNDRPSTSPGGADRNAPATLARPATRKERRCCAAGELAARCRQFGYRDSLCGVCMDA